MKPLLASLVLSVAVVAPAAATTPAPTLGTATSLGALLDSGYELKSTVPFSAEEQKTLYPDDAVAVFVILILQKGPSLASCVIKTASVINLSPRSLANINVCTKR